MTRVIYSLVVLIIALAAVVRSQTPTTADQKNTASPPGAPSATQPAPKVEDCACESQPLPEVLAIVNGVTITSADIGKTTRESVRQLQNGVIDARKRELDLAINSKLLAIEAKKRGMSTTKLLEQEVVSKVKRPTLTEAQAFYDLNRARIKDPFKDVAEDIMTYLLDQRERLEAKKFADLLRQTTETKVLVTETTPPANEAERARVLATVKGEAITSGDIEDSLRPLIYDVQGQVYKLRKDELDLAINDTLLASEAQKRKITINALLDAEVKPNPITDEQMRTFYEQNKDRVSGDFTVTKDAIRQYLEQLELRQAQRVFVEKLRAAASIQVFLVAPESPVFSVSTTDQPSLGSADAPVTIIAFTDYQCPSCAAMHSSLESLVKEYGAQIRIVMRDFPLNQHADAFKAAEAAEAAREQGRYWEYIQVLMRNQSSLGVEKLKSYATELGLDQARFNSALDSGKFAELVERDVDDAVKLGLKTTPALFVNGRRVSATTYADLKALVEAALKASSARPQERTTSTNALK